jgi:hypothetical protein
MTDELRSFLELNLPKPKEGKKAKYSLGVVEPKVGSHISEVTGIPCQSNEFVQELLRGVRLHFDRFINELKVSPFSVPYVQRLRFCIVSSRCGSKFVNMIVKLCLLGLRIAIVVFLCRAGCLVCNLVF